MKLEQAGKLGSELKKVKKKVSLSKKPDAVMDKLNHRGKSTV